MSAPSPQVLAWRRRIEAGLRVAGPALDLLLAVGERVSRLAGPEEREPLPPAPRSPALRPRRLTGAAPRTSD